MTSPCMFAKSPVLRLYEPAGLFSGRGDSPHYSIVPAFMNREPLQCGSLPGIPGTAPGAEAGDRTPVLKALPEAAGGRAPDRMWSIPLCAVI